LLNSIPEHLPEIIYLDIETTGLNFTKDNITSIQALLGEGTECIYIDSNIPSFANALYDKIALNQTRIVGHNLMFDLSFLSHLTSKNWFEFDIMDTMLLSRARGHTQNGLKHLATLYSEYHPMAYKAAMEYNQEYAIVDVICTRDIYAYYTRKPLRAIDTLSMESLKTFGYAHIQGIRVDINKLDTAYEELQTELKQIEQALDAANPYINWNSNKEVSEALVEFGIPLTTTTATGAYSVAVKALEPFRDAYPIIDLLLKYRQLNKLVGSFYESYKDKLDLENPYVYPSVNILGAQTGRTSCTNPNIQQVPSSVKSIFISRFEQGLIGQFDLAQAELRCAALLTGDKDFIHALHRDAHTAIAARAFNIAEEKVSKQQRQLGKTVNFSVLYGAKSAKNLADRVGSDETTIQNIFNAFWEAYPSIKQWQEEQVSIAYNYLKSVDVFGKIRDYRLTNQYSRGKIRREAINTPVQALSAYICLLLCNYISCSLAGYKSYVMMQVHDSVFVDVHPEEKGYVIQICKDAFKYLNTIPEIVNLPGYGLISIGGELSFNKSMKEETSEYIELSS
jgi:DNA polymerase-1